MPIDLKKPLTVAGHSTGGRVALMIAALVDTIESDKPYLNGTAAAEGLTPEMISVLPRIKAIIGDHPDAMYDPKLNPDIENYRIDKLSTFIITGSKDSLEPDNSGWIDF